METKCISAGMAVFAATLAFPAIASAQWNNQPYQFRNSGVGGAGMSTAYRQAIIDKELLGRRPENLVKGADGRLLEVYERDQQAFLAEREPSFIVPRSGYGTGAVGSYFALGGGMVQLYAGARASSSPIDAWISMLE